MYLYIQTKGSAAFSKIDKMDFKEHVLKLFWETAQPAGYAVFFFNGNAGLFIPLLRAALFILDKYERLA